MGRGGGVPVRDEEHLHAELDRQLAEVRASCDGLATRSGLLVAATAAVTAVLGPRIDPARHVILLVLTAVALAIAIVTAVITLMPQLKEGPERIKLAGWIKKPSAETSQQLYDAKLIILSGNQDYLIKMRTLFATQAVATVCAAGLALGYTAWR
jgi:hypothetical protein